VGATIKEFLSGDVPKIPSFPGAAIFQKLLKLLLVAFFVIKMSCE